MTDGPCVFDRCRTEYHKKNLKKPPILGQKKDNSNRQPIPNQLLHGNESGSSWLRVGFEFSSGVPHAKLKPTKTKLHERQKLVRRKSEEDYSRFRTISGTTTAKKRHPRKERRLKKGISV